MIIKLYDYQRRTLIHVITYFINKFRNEWLHEETIRTLEEFLKKLKENQMKDNEEDKKNYKKTLLFDFDGVIHSYTSGWKGIDVIPDGPVEGIRELIIKLREEYTVKIYSSRCLEEKGINAIEEYLVKYNIFVDGIARNKEKAFLIIDDRAITFKGDCKSLVDEIKNFKVWNKK
jgi:hypothetical protein